MSNKLKDFRKRLSVRNQSLTENKLGEVAEDFDLDNLPECEEKIVTKEEDPLKFFSQEQRKKEKQEKEEQRKKYLNPIKEEDDPLHYFEKNKINEEADEDPLNFVKSTIEKPSDDLPKTLGIMISEYITEKTLSEKILKNDIPEELNIGKPVSEKVYTKEERKKKMEKRFKTSLRLSQRKGFEERAKDKLMERLKNYRNNKANAGDTIKNVEIINEKTNNGTTLLSAEEQVNTQTTTKTKKDVDLSSFMKKKNEN
jgi:hypothetical protein